MVEMVDTLDLGSRFWGFESLFPYKSCPSIPTGRENGFKPRKVPVLIRGEIRKISNNKRIVNSDSSNVN